MASITNSSLEEKIHNLAQKSSEALLKQINFRLEEMKVDDTSHFLIYRVLGITEQEGRLGDHITKEHTRIKAISTAGYKPIRIMFYYPNRQQAIRIQQTLETLYKGIGGEYYYGESAWNYVTERTGIDLKAILQRIADQNTASDE